MTEIYFQQDAMLFFEMALKRFRGDTIDDTGCRCLICTEIYAEDEIENHVIEEHPEAMEVFPEFDVRDLPFVVLF